MMGVCMNLLFNIFRFRELDVPPPFEEELQEVLDLELEPVEIEDDGLLEKFIIKQIEHYIPDGIDELSHIILGHLCLK
jgi:hypothetical protein